MSVAALSSSEHLVRVTGLSKRFGNQQVLRSISLSLNQGEIVLLLGSNGAGKSTFLKICSGLLRSDGGTVERALPRGAYGYVAHEPMVYAHLTVRENLRLFADLNQREDSTSSEIKQWGLSSHSNTRVADLSKGLQLRVSLARAFQSEPRVLFLDEPTSALDEESVQSLSGALLTMVHSGALPGAALIATHDIQRLKPIANRVVLLSDGRIDLDSNELESQGMGESAACESVVSRYRERNR